MELIAFVVAVVSSLLMGRFLFGVFFRDGDDFMDCVRYAFTPDLFSLFRGDYLQDLAQSMKLGFYVWLVILPGVGAYYGTLKGLVAWFG